MTTVIDVVRDRGKKKTLAPWEVAVIRDTDTTIDRNFRPYFYIIAHRDLDPIELEHTLLHTFKKTIRNMYRKIATKYGTDTLRELEEQPYTIEETRLRPWIFKTTGQDPNIGRYVRTDRYKVYRVQTHIPSLVKEVATRLLKERPLGNQIKLAAFNIIYQARYTLDHHWCRILDIEPIYYDIDTEIDNKLTKLTYTVLDLEELKDGTKILSLLTTNLNTETPEEAETKIETYIWKKPTDPEAEEARKRLEEAKTLVGYNILRYDIRQLVKNKILSKTALLTKSLIDLCDFVTTHATALGVGTVSYALHDVLHTLKDKLKLAPEDIERSLHIKMRGQTYLTTPDRAVHYNRNDVKITWALAELLLQTIFGISGITQIPPSVTTRVNSGLLLHYTLIHWYEIHGEIIEARKVFTTDLDRLLLKGEKVYTFKDINEFYTTYGEKIRKILEETQDIQTALKKIKTHIATPLLQTIKRRARAGKRSTITETLHVGKIVHIDIDMMYPTKIKTEHIAPEAYIRGHAEDATFRADTYESPYYALITRLYNVRWNLKQEKKRLEKTKEELEKTGAPREQIEQIKKKIEQIKLSSDLVKPLVNASFGLAGQTKGYVHGGHLEVALKIFHDTVRDLLTLMLYAKARGYEVLYGDTDSIFMKIPQHLDDKKVVEDLAQAAKALGYTISHEGTYTYMFIIRKKTYVVGKTGQFIKLKGQALGRMKFLMSTYVRTLLLEALRQGTIKPIIEGIQREDDIAVLLPSLTRTYADIVLKTVQDIKRMNEEKLTTFLKVIVGHGETTKTGLLKSITPSGIQIARLIALALTAGTKTGNTYIIDFTKIEDIENLPDLKALLLVHLGKRDTLSSDYVLVAVPQKDNTYRCVIATADKNNITYILLDLHKKEKREIPTKYKDPKGRPILPTDRKYLLLGMKIPVHIIREVDTEEVKRHILATVARYLEKTKLHILLRDYHELTGKAPITPITAYIA